MDSGQSLLKLRRCKNIIKSKHFRSSFLTIMLCTTILFIIGSILATIQSMLKLQETLEMKANHTAVTVQEVLTNIRSSAAFVGNMPSVDLLFHTSLPTTDQLFKMQNDVEPYASLYDYESIVLFFEPSKRIYDSAGGFYTYDDFYNPDLLDQLDTMPTEDMWLINVPYTRYYEPRPAVPVISYIKKLPLYEVEQKCYISVSYSMKLLQKTAQKSTAPAPYTVAVCFGDALLWSNSTELMEYWNPASSIKENESYIKGLSRQYSSITDIGASCTYYVSHKELLRTFLPDLFYLLGLYCIASVVMFIISVIYSTIMLRPVDAIMKKIGTTPYTGKNGSLVDEFALISNAFDHMTNQMRNIDSVMHENKQLVRERLLTGIIYNYVDIHQLSPQYEQNGIHFSCPYFSVVLISIPALDDLDDYTRQEQLKLIVRNNAADAFSSLGIAYSLYIDKVICILLNTSLGDHLQEELTKICTALKSSIKQTLSLYPLFSIGICSQNDPKPWQAWQLARQNFIFTATDSEDFVLFSFQNEYCSSVDSDLLAGFTQCIIDKNMVQLRSLTAIFRQLYLTDSTDLSEARRLTIIALGTIFTSLLELNVTVHENQITGYINKIGISESLNECDTHLFVCLSNIIDTETKISEESRGYVRKAMDYLEAHYAEQITVPQVASSVSINPIYLNKIFKLSTGKTLSEYLNYYRIKQSLEMLTDSENTINCISELVGYNDVRSYIRFFKKFYHMTPNEYRKGKREKSTD